MTKTTKDPLPIRTRDAYHARPSETEPGMWTLMQQEAGKPYASGLARVFHVQGAARLLAGLEALGYEVEKITPVATVEIGEGVGGRITPFAVDIFADGSAFHAETGARIAKKDHAKLSTDQGETLASVIAATVRVPEGGGE